jgi:hypothetical protein
VSRLDYAPPLKEVQITDIKKGIGIFTPKPEKPVSFAALKQNLKKSGYVLASAGITVSGKLSREDGQWSIVATTSEQRFNLSDPDTLLANMVAGEVVEVTGNWKTQEKEPSELISLKSLKKESSGSRRYIHASRICRGADSCYVSGTDSLQRRRRHPANLFHQTTSRRSGSESPGFRSECVIHAFSPRATRDRIAGFAHGISRWSK